jgi:hypothetical protein
MSDELQKIAWASTSGGASGGQAREPVLWEDGLLLRILGHDGVTSFDFPSLDLLGDLDGAASIGADDSGFSVIGGSTVQALLASIDAALDGLAGSGYLLADGSIPYAGSQSLAGFNLTDVGSVEFSDGQELTSNAHSILAEADVISHGNDGYNEDGDKARFAVVGGDDATGLAGMVAEYGFGLILSVFSYGATGGKMGENSLDVLKIIEQTGEVGILAEPVVGSALTLGGSLNFVNGIYSAILSYGPSAGFDFGAQLVAKDSLRARRPSDAADFLQMAFSNANNRGQIYAWDGGALAPLLVSEKHFLNSDDLFSGTSGWVDFSADLSLSGFDSAGLIAIAKYKMVGKLCHVHLDISGAANASFVGFNLPADAGEYVEGSCLCAMRAQNSGGYAIGCILKSSGERAAVVYKDAAGTGWNSASAFFSADFTYRADVIPS